MSDGLLGFLDAVRRQWLAVLLVFVPLVAGAAYYTSTLPDEYQATAVVGFSPRAERTPSADVVQLLLPKYEVFVSSPSNVQEVAEDLDVQPTRVAESLDPDIPPETATLRIRITDGDADFAAEAANEFADTAVRFAGFDGVLDAVVVARAVAPDAPSGPPRRLFMAAAGVTALIAAAALALAIERLRPRIRAVPEISVHTGLRVLGRIPRRRSLRGNPIDALADQVVGSAVRATRTTIDRESRDQPVHVLVVSSALEHEGKTTFATLLAASLSRLDARVLLIDADLIRPRVARRFDLTPRNEGLAALLRKDISFDEAVAHEGNLHVIPSAADPDASDLMVRRFSNVLAEARARYDIVVIDAPPLLGNDLTGTISSFGDGTVLVVGRSTLAAAVRQAVTTMESLGVRALGAVANGFSDPVETYYVGR